MRNHQAEGANCFADKRIHTWCPSKPESTPRLAPTATSPGQCAPTAMRDRPAPAASTHNHQWRRRWATVSAKYMPDATANAVSVWPEGMDTLCSSSPTTRICALSTTAAGRGLSMKNLPVRANSTAKGAAHSHATISRGASTNKGDVTASTPQPLPNSERPVQNAAATGAHHWLMVRKSAGSDHCSHKGVPNTKISTGHHQVRAETGLARAWGVVAGGNMAIRCQGEGASVSRGCGVAAAQPR